MKISKIQKKAFITFVVVFALAFFSASVYDTLDTTIDIPFIPELTIGGKELPRLEAERTIRDAEIKLELVKLFPKTPSYKIGLADRIYEIPQHSSMKEMIDYMADFYWSTPHMRYTPEAYDCDNFARTFVVFGDLASREGFKGGQIALFRIYVKNVYSWGGVSGNGGGHALVLFRSSCGWFVYEPQGTSIVKAEDYPNRDYIWQILGD